MKLGERMLFFNVRNFNQDRGHLSFLFKKQPWGMKKLKVFLSSGLIVAICLAAITAKMAIEAFFRL